MRAVCCGGLHESLAVRVLSSRALVYTNVIDESEDRPPHVRAASAIAARGDELFVVQDDAGFIARVRGETITAIPLPRGPGGRRRFEVSLGNKLDKLDLESAVIVGDELWAFGSGTIPIREHVVRMSFDGRVQITHEAALYARLRAAVGGAINIEGVTHAGGEFVFFHRGNTSASDAPAIVYLRGAARTLRGPAEPSLATSGDRAERVDLGRVDGIAIGFTDACAVGDVIVFIAAAESSPNAIDDGRVLASVLGVIDREGVRTTPLELAGKPEGLALRDEHHAWITVDPDDPDVPTTLYEVAIDGIKPSK